MLCLYPGYCIQFCSLSSVSVKIELEENSEMVNKDKGIEKAFHNSELKW